MYRWFLISNLLLFISGVRLVTSKDVFYCSNGEEIPSDKYCDGVTQCSDNSDEDPDICDITSDEFNCDTPGEVISINKTCDGIKDCTDGSDESSSACIDHKCDDDKFQCAYGGCINNEVVCNGVMDCTDGTDEQEARCSSIQKKCKLPDVQPTISYNVFGCTSCKPGEHVKALTKINFTCNEGYAFETSQPFFVAECKDSKWLPEIPICRELTLPNRRLLNYLKGFCPPIVRSYGTNVACRSKNDFDVNCKEPVHVGTEATFTCEKYYKLKGSVTSSVCLNNGQWSHNNIRCESSCFSGSEVALVVHGTPIIKDNEVFPWVAGLYGINEKHWEYRCGATLISDNVLITAAHCVWNEKPKDLKIVIGKIYRDFYLNESKQESYNVKNIRMLSVYQDRNGNYGSDVAILILYSRIHLSDDTHPVCIEWNEATSNEITTPGTSGLVAGWGFTEDDKPSNELRYINIPIIDDAECIKNEPVEFRKYVTYTSFCAGYKNGTSVCNGDSGSGLVFNSNGNWYIEGLVSVSPRRTNAFLCEPTLFSIFTKIGSYKSWIKAILNEAFDK